MCGHSFPPQARKDRVPGGPGFSGMAASSSVSRSTPLAKMLSGRIAIGLDKAFSLHDAIAAAGRCGFGLARSARK